MARALWEAAPERKARSSYPPRPLSTESSYLNRSYREALLSSQSLKGFKGGGHKSRTEQGNCHSNKAVVKVLGVDKALLTIVTNKSQWQGGAGRVAVPQSVTLNTL